MQLTTNQLRLELKELAEADGQINSFFWGEQIRAWTENEVVYPLMAAFYPSGQFLPNQTDIQLNIAVFDLTYDDPNVNFNDVESDTLQIVRRVYQVMNASPRWKRLGKVVSASFDKVIDFAHDKVTGHGMILTFRLRDDYGICGLPIFNYDFDVDVPTPVDCNPARVVNTSLTYDTEVASGGFLELPNVSFIVRNSELTQILSADVPAVTNITGYLPDITITDSDGSPVAYPSGKDFTCTPAQEPFTVAKVLMTGQTNDYAEPGADVNRGRLVGFFTVDYIHEFGHAFRFCGKTGGYSDGVGYFDINGVTTSRALAFPDSTVLDMSSRNVSEILTYYIGDIATYRGYDTAINLYLTTDFGGLIGWHLWNDFEMNNIRNVDAFNAVTHWVGYAPFEFTSSERAFITSTRSGTEIVRTDFQSMGYAEPTTITNQLLTVYVRYTTLTELGL